jgi:hypothetical protein
MQWTYISNGDDQLDKVETIPSAKPGSSTLTQ